MSGVRSTYAWQLLRARVIAQAKAAGTPCAICGYPIDFAAPARSRYSASVDHVTPISLGGAPLDAANCAPCHYSCNSARGNGTRRRSAPTREPQKRAWSRKWFADGPVPDQPEMVSVSLPICDGRACTCQWMASGPDVCSQGPPQWVEMKVPKDRMGDAAA